MGGDLVRASGLVNVPELITEFGGDPNALMAEAGIDPAAAGDYNSFITYTALAQVIGQAGTDLGVHDLGLRLSRRQDLEMLGPIAVMARNAERVEAALLGVIKYLHTYSPCIEADLRSSGPLSRFSFRITLRQLPHRPYMVELALGVILGMFRMLVDEAFRPVGIAFCHRPMSPMTVYEDHFGCPVDFEADANTLTFPTGVLSRAITGGDGQAHNLAVRYLGAGRRHRDVDQHVFELLGKLLRLGQANLVDVARVLNLHPRVLQRRLALAGTPFEQLLDEARRTAAEELLSSPGVSLSTIAQQLGYSEQSSLTRSCQRWFGEPPLAVRRRIGARRAH
ncbi:MAG: AraC family transcriptional regulator [Pseudonocardia sp.]|nr:AraC family transcriptional regulator [Pseudonocardia sp.]